MSIAKRMLGKTGIAINPLGLGLWPAGGTEWGGADDKASLEVINAALEAGIDFFDTADVYGNGHSERLLAQAMRGRRDRFIVATKIGWQGFDEVRGRTAYDTVDKLIAGVETNLRRLETDYIDVLQSHINFHDPTMEVFLEGFGQLQRDGKIRAYGVSTSDFDYLKAFNRDGGCATLQIDYSILNRTAESDILPYCQANNIGVIIRGPLAMGILTGKMTSGTQFVGDDFRQAWQTDPEQYRVFIDDLAKVEQLRPLANGRTLAQAALQFTLAHPATSVVIPGARNLRQLEDNLGAIRLSTLSASDMRLIDRIVPPGDGRKIWPA